MISPKQIIRVLVVDDSAVVRRVIVTGLADYPGIEVVGFAINAMDAQSKITKLSPDVVTMDVEMPGMNGIESLKQFLPVHPIPVILVSSLNLRIFDALEAGAVDFVRKPDDTENCEHFLRALAQKIMIASQAKVFRKRCSSPFSPIAPAAISNISRTGVGQTIIALGASTGGTEATLEVLKRLPADIPGMVIVQHMPEGFTKMYADRLNRICKMQVREAVTVMKFVRELY